MSDKAPDCEAGTRSWNALSGNGKPSDGLLYQFGKLQQDIHRAVKIGTWISGAILSALIVMLVQNTASCARSEKPYTVRIETPVEPESVPAEGNEP